MFSLSNLGAKVLGVALERHNNKSFEQLVIGNICLPLGMKNTSLEDAGVVQGYNEKGRPMSYWHLESLAGSGAIRSTLDDMIIFMKAQVGSKNKLTEAIHLTHQITIKLWHWAGVLKKQETRRYFIILEVQVDLGLLLYLMINPKKPLLFCPMQP